MLSLLPNQVFLFSSAGPAFSSCKGKFILGLTEPGRD